MQDPVFGLEAVSKTYAVRTGLFAARREFFALREISFSLRRGAFYALVGESGSGKTTLAKLLVGLAEPSGGRIAYAGRPLADWLARGRREFTSRVQMIFQNPFLSLDPRWRVEAVVSEGIASLAAHKRRRKAAEMLEKVRLPGDYGKRYASELSGGERQRVALARALAMAPEFLILDEPTSQLDVSVQAEIADLLRELRPSLTGGLLLITHDMAFASHLAEELVVLYSGSIMETGEMSEVLASPKADYTRRLIRAVPRWPPEGWELQRGGDD